LNAGPKEVDGQEKTPKVWRSHYLNAGEKPPNKVGRWALQKKSPRTVLRTPGVKRRGINLVEQRRTR